MKSKNVMFRPNTCWYTPQISQLKRARRKAESAWRKSKSVTDKHLYQEAKNKTNKAIEDAKKEYLRDSLIKNKHNPKELHKTLNGLIKHDTNDRILPEHQDVNELAERFNNYFEDKIKTIRNSLDQLNINDLELPTVHRKFTHPLATFPPVNNNETLQMIKNAPNKSCKLDTIPTSIIKACADKLAPAITSIINASIEKADFPPTLKQAHVSPLIKKSNLDPNNMKNFRPVSNLNFISKLIEKAVVKRLRQHLQFNNINIEFQSAYKPGHSTETALLRVYNDIIMKLKRSNNVMLILLDLSAAFDTIDHTLLLQRLETMFGIQGPVLCWFKEYITNRTQMITLKNTSSTPIRLNFGVPQGSVLGPVLFTLYTAELSSLISSFDLDHHLYADDTQLYQAITISSKQRVLDTVESCTSKIKQWMTENKLKLNEEKTELIVFRKNNTDNIIDKISVNGTIINCATSVRNLGFYFDDTLTMNSHISRLCQNLHYQIRNIYRVRHLLDEESCKILVHSLITSRLDYCNSLLHGLPKSSLQKLQKIQNTSARLVTNTRKYDHITPVLKKLHWLPIENRIEYKLACFVFKCLTGSAPAYLSTLIEIYHPPRSLRSSNSLKLSTWHSETKFLDRSFINAAPRIWNSLSYDTRSCLTFSSFSSKLKTELFHRAFDTC